MFFWQLQCQSFCAISQAYWLFWAHHSELSHRQTTSLEKTWALSIMVPFLASEPNHFGFLLSHTLHAQQSGNLVIIFATVGNLQHLGRAETWYGDGTFSVCPSLFYQLYTIHAEVYGQILLLVFALLPSKSRECYQFMWMNLRNLMLERGIFPSLHSYRSCASPPSSSYSLSSLNCQTHNSPSLVLA